MTPEQRLSLDVREALKTLGCAVYSTEQGYRRERGGTRTSAGIPDLIVFGPGGWTFAELKTAQGKLNKAQQVFRDECCSGRGVPWALWRSVSDAVDWFEFWQDRQ